MLFICGIGTRVFAGVNDTVLTARARLATAKDSSAAVPDTAKKHTDVDSVVYAEGRDSLIFFISRKKMNIYGKGALRYKATNLKSGKILVDFQTNNVNATGMEKDSSGKTAEDYPVMVDRGEEYKGTRMKYNFKTSRGYITYAATKADEAAYSGARINKVDRNTFFVENGIYTTCDEKEPHFCFYGHEMKVIQKEQMIAKWVWLTFGNVPFPIPAPFAVVPLQSGRRSGLIPPAYGERTGYGKYFSHLGYYWAISDYTDWAATTDLYTKGGFALQSSFHYALRYNYTGYVEGNYSKLHQGLTTDPDYASQKDWRVRVVHNQSLSPSSRFDANLEFMSGTYFRQNTTDYNQLLRNEIFSNASYYKSWEESGISMNMNYSRRQDLQTNNIQEVLPSLGLSKSTFYPFRKKNFTGDEKWYEMIGIGYSGQFQNNRNVTDGNLKIRGGIQHTMSTGISPRIGYFNISPNVSYRELWYNKYITKKSLKNTAGLDSEATQDVNAISFVRTYSLGIGASTKVFGIFQPQFAGIAAVRHIIQPSLSYNFTPDFSKPGFGYYDSYTKSDGTVVKYNKYEREIYGGASSGESQSISFRLDNIFDMKTMVDPTDTLSKEKKFNLLNLSSDISYNFAADSLRFSDINLSYRTQIGQALSLSGYSSYSLYDYDAAGKTIDRYLWKDKKQFVRNKSLNFSASFSMSGDKSSAADKTTLQPGSEQQILPSEIYLPQENRILGSLYPTTQPDFTIPWSISLSYNFSQSRPSPLSIYISSNISGNLNFNLTPSWKFSVTGSYDMRQKLFAAPQVSVSRDLHCWLLSFTWNPIGQYTGYRLEIRVKAPQLQDLKITKTDNFFSGRR